MTEQTYRPSGQASGLDAYFKLTESGTTVRTEVIAGITTFLTMAYIVFVNPAILSEAGMPFGPVFVATCVAAIIGTLIMGLYANYPIALAPGMGLNAFFAFTVVITYGYTWQEALACVFFSGVLFIILSVLPIREYIINSIPKTLKLAISAGIGFFLGIIALSNAGVVVAHPATLVTSGDFLAPGVILALLGFALIAALNFRNVPGATIIGILVVAVIGIPFGVAEFGGIVSLPPNPSETFLALDFGRVLEGTFWIVVLSMLFVDLFDTAGTLVGVAHRGGLLDKDGKLPRMNKALLADSTATTVGALVGTSNTTSYVESAAGVAAGGRTGLAAVVTAACFGLALFFSPLAGSIPAYATAAALFYVAVVMARGLAEIDWDDLTEAAPAVAIAITMPLTYSIATGIGIGFITYVLVKAIAGRVSELTPAVWALAVVFAVMLAIV
ncbi:NCS2 family permease [Chelativorans sp. ZYF759]|uniref:NCS2 family permease n=1 Tax=Chelativorans sp. ZYF759 TaxID=2692213 RepID=UPI00145D61E4|nr:NCS2 family permease [Chelativorans sp. ZYF759]NMG40043.1 NCS2 family permease [Chelativorans sp. ZYF759]